MNVLLTRARRGLIIIGNRKTLMSDKDSTWKKWVTWVENEELIVDSGKCIYVQYIAVENLTRSPLGVPCFVINRHVYTRHC